jgi:ribonuclease III
MKSQVTDPSALEDALGHRFQRRALLDQALTHSSFAREAESAAGAQLSSDAIRDNEQLEFLGDAVLSFVVSQELFRRFPSYTEGDLSKLRAHIVSARALIRPARQLEIGRFLRFGKGEEKSGGRTKNALLVNALEALIAALFLDSGLEPAYRLIVNSVLEPALAELHDRGAGTLPVTDYKSALQEVVHAAGRPHPQYSVVKEEGPDHRKVFTVEVSIAAPPSGGELFVTRAEASTKKRAEQRAARQAWEYLHKSEVSPRADVSTVKSGALE